MNKQIVLYGFGGPSDNYRVVRNYVLRPEESIRGIVSEEKYQARRMRAACPNIKIVYAIDNRYGLRKDYLDAVKLNSMEGWVLFKDICEREGMIV